MTEHEAREYIRFRLRVRYGSLSAFAAHRGCTPAYISKLVMHSELPQWLLDEAGLTKTVCYTAAPAAQHVRG